MKVGDDVLILAPSSAFKDRVGTVTEITGSHPGTSVHVQFGLWGDWFRPSALRVLDAIERLGRVDTE